MVLLLILLFFFLSNELLDEAEQRAFVLIKCIICPQTTKFSPRIRKLNVQKCKQLQNNSASLYFFHIFIICPQTTKCQNQSLIQMSKNAHSYLNINFIKLKHILFNLWYTFWLHSRNIFWYLIILHFVIFMVFNHSTFCHFHVVFY